MKKSIFFVLTILSVLILSSCVNNKIDDKQISVVFFTFDRDQSIGNYVLDEVDVLIDAPDDPHRPGFNFLGWSKSPFIQDLWDFDQDHVEKSMVLYAVWGPGFFQIEYELNGGSFAEGTTVITEFSSGQTVFLPNPVLFGYTFDGWYLNPIDQLSLGEQPIQSISGVIDDVVVNAKWSAVSVLIQFRANTGDVTGLPNPIARMVSYNSVIDFPVLANTATHRFVGWRDSANVMYVNGELFKRTVPATLQAVWEPIS